MPNCLRYIFVIIAFLFVSQYTFSQSCTDCTKPGNLNFKFVLDDVELGDTLPVDFLICGFRDIIAFQLPVSYNPANMTLVSCQEQFLPNWTCTDFTEPNPGEIRVRWEAPDITVPISLDNEDVMFTLFFVVSGVSESPDSIKIVENFGPFGIEFIKGDPSDPSSTVINDFCQDGGEFFTECPQVTGFISGCGGTAAGSGSFELSLCGGDAPFDYLIVSSTGENSGTGTIPDNRTPLNIDELDPGKDYTIEIRDVNGALITTENISIEVQEPMDVNIDISARLSNTGSGLIPCASGQQSVTSLEALVSPSGMYQYAWSNGGLGDEIDRVPAGNYTVTVTDLVTGCKQTDSFTLNSPDPIEISIVDLKGPACDDPLALGSVSLKITGGLPEFNGDQGVYEVRFENPMGDPPQRRASRPDGTIIYSIQTRPEGGLLAGTEWTISVDDYAFGFQGICDSQDTTFTVPEPTDGFIFSVGDTIVKCDGLADVTFSIDPPLPDPPPTQSDNLFIFDSLGNELNIPDKRILRSGDTVNDIPPGTYTFTYESLIDVCNGGGTFTVEKAATLTIEPNSLIPIQPGCGSGGAFGTVDIVATGGTGVYEYTWSDDLTARDESMRDDLMPGINYFVTVTDSGDCEVISQDAIVIMASDALTVSPDSIVALGSDCNGNPGFIQLMTSPTDTNNYILDIVTQQVPGTMITDLPDGDYELTVRLDGNQGCFDGPFSITLKSQAGLSLFVDDIEITPISCDGTLGSLRLPPLTGAQGRYQLQFTDGGADTTSVVDNTITDIEAGMYTLIAGLEDNPDCVLSFPDIEFVETIPIDLNEQDFVISQPSCSTGDMGSAVIDVTGGVAPLSFAWDDGVTLIDEATRSDLLPGTNYFLTVTDAAGCEVSTMDTIIINNVVPLIDPSLVIGQGPDCRGNVGMIRLELEPTDTNTYVMDIGTQQVEGREITGLEVGTYDLNVSLKYDAQCAAGPFELVLDSESDFMFSEEMIERRLPDCNGKLGSLFFPTADDEELVFMVAGRGELQDNPIEGFEPGIEYLVTIAFEFNQSCNITIPIEFAQPEETILSVQEASGPACGGDGNDGLIALNLDGNLDDLRFEWNDGFEDNSVNRDSLAIGTYTVTVYNGTGCSDTLSNIELGFELNEPFPAFAQEEDASCRGVGNGIRAFEDPDDIYEFTWDDTGLPSDMRNDLVGDQEYIVTRTIQGIQSCSDTMSFTIGTSARLDVDTDLIVEVPPTCAGGLGSLTIPDNAVMNGIAPYVYNLSFGADQEIIAVDDDITDGQGFLIDVPAGNYLGYIRDSVGCEFNFPATLSDGLRINLPNAPTRIADPSCLGDSDGSYSIIASGGTVGIFDFTWSSGENQSGVTESTASALSTGMQSVIVSDGVCDPDTVFFNVNPGAQVSINPTGTTVQDVECFNENSGIIQIDIIGLLDEFTFDWEDFPTQNVNRLTDLTQGSYTVTITDNNTGCTIDTLFIVESPDELRIDIDRFNTVDISCRNQLGAISVNASGGTGDYEFNWTDDVSNTFTAVDLPPGEYEIDIEDANGCTDTLMYELIAEQPIMFEVSEYVPILCADGTTSVGVQNIEGGVPPYRYSIIDGGQLFEDSTTVEVGAGNYTFNVFDSDGCQAVSKIEEDIVDPIPPMISLGQDTTIDLGETYRFIPDVVAEFGVDSINYMSDATLFPVTGDGIGVQPDRDVTIFAQLVDMNGCIATDEVFIKVSKSRKVYIPNVIYKSSSAPNNAQNTIFAVYTGLGVTQVLSMQVFDRWGNIMHQQTNLPANNLGIGVGGWNGEFGGDRVESGVYGYLVKVEFSDGQILDYKGSVTVIN